MATIEVSEEIVAELQRFQDYIEGLDFDCDEKLMGVVYLLRAVWSLTPDRRFAIVQHPVRVEDHAPQPDCTEELPLIYPKELSHDLKRILSTEPHHATGIAAALRVTGQDVPSMPDEEQAAVVHFFLTQYLKNPICWKNRVRQLFRDASLAQVQKDREQAGSDPKF